MKAHSTAHPCFDVFIAAAETQPTDRSNVSGCPLPVIEIHHPSELKRLEDWSLRDVDRGIFEEGASIFRPKYVLGDERKRSPHSEWIKKAIDEICVRKRARIKVLGLYVIAEKNIHYYKMDRQYLPIVQVHERMHAIQHLLKDDTGNVWGDFPKVHGIYKELLAQLFTYKYLEAVNDIPMLDLMEKMAENQGLQYKTYKLFRHWNHAECVALYWRIREKGCLPGIFDEAFSKPLGVPSGENAATVRGGNSIVMSGGSANAYALITISDNKGTLPVCRIARPGELEISRSGPVQSLRPGQQAFLVDPEGNVISLIQLTNKWHANPKNSKQGVLGYSEITRWEFPLPLDGIEYLERKERRTKPVKVIGAATASAILAASHAHNQLAHPIAKAIVGKGK